MTHKTSFIERIALRNYKSIGICDVRLHPLTYLVGNNGAGKSNFMDALHLVRDALSNSLASALNDRGGIDDVIRRGSSHPLHFAIRINFVLPDGQRGHYGFIILALKHGCYTVQREECVVTGNGKSSSFRIAKGELLDSSESTFPAVTTDRLALVAASGMSVFRPVFDTLSAMGFYNLDPELMRKLQKPQDGRLLKPTGENIASVIGHLEKVAPAKVALIQKYLRTMAPMVCDVMRKTIGPVETLEFLHDMGHFRPSLFLFAQSMSDGVLRALGVLSALLQSNIAYSPTLIGINEPETALHPAAITALREVFSSKTTQVLATSNSPDLLDDQNIDADSVLAVVFEQGETNVAPLDEGSRKVMRDHLFSVGELLRMNQLEPDRASIERQNKAVSDDPFFEARISKYQS